MIRLDDLHLFLRSAALGGFSDAAREANLLPGQVSAAIKRLERELDIRLFARSTRSLRLTPEGERYLPYATDALAQLAAGRENLAGDEGALRGVLQIAAPSDLGRNVLLPWIAEFRREHPELTLRLSLSDQVTDVFRDPVDAAIRYGHNADASFVALPLAPNNRRVLAASPDYIARHGKPRTLDDLTQHDCLLYALNSRIYDRWVFFEGEQRRVVRVRGPFQCDDADVTRRLALEGEGIVYKSALDLHDDLKSGRLVRLLPKIQGEPTPLNLVCPHRKQFSPAVRLLHEWIRVRCEA